MPGTLDSPRLIQRLRKLRQDQRKSAQDVADATGIPRSVIANLESGRRATITVEEAAAICDVLGIDFRTALTDEHELTVTTDARFRRGQPGYELISRTASCVCGWTQPVTNESSDELLAAHLEEMAKLC